MMAMTPMGTAVLSITSPLGRLRRVSTWPTGSGRPATSRTPWAMLKIRSSLRARRSSITVDTVPLASIRSSPLAVSTDWMLSASASAMARSARFLASVPASAMAPLACLAR